MSELLDVRMKVSRPPTGVYDGMWCEHIVTFHDQDGRVYEARTHNRSTDCVAVRVRVGNTSMQLEVIEQ